MSLITSKVTSKLQVTIPKALADRYGIRPGDEIEWEPAGSFIRVVPAGGPRSPLDVEERLQLFDAARERQRAYEDQHPAIGGSTDRGWTREDLYDRGRAD